jgi:hypothetical protein
LENLAPVNRGLAEQGLSTTLGDALESVHPQLDLQTIALVRFFSSEAIGIETVALIHDTPEELIRKFPMRHPCVVHVAPPEQGLPSPPLP